MFDQLQYLHAERTQLVTDYMKPVVLLLITLITLSELKAQSYEQVLKKCIKNFHEGLGQFTKDNATTEIERRYDVLNECIRGQKFPAFNLTTYNGSKYSSQENANKV